MGSFSIWHWLVVLAVILVLFGGGNKISGLMGDFAKGIKSFKKNMNEPDDESMEELRRSRRARSPGRPTVAQRTQQRANPPRQREHRAGAGSPDRLNQLASSHGHQPEPVAGWMARFRRG